MSLSGSVNTRLLSAFDFLFCHPSPLDVLARILYFVLHMLMGTEVPTLPPLGTGIQDTLQNGS